MRTFIVIAFISLVIILLIAFRKQLATFFGWDTAPVDGDPCTDSNGNPSRIENGVCKEIVIPSPPAETQTRVITPRYDFPYYMPGYSFPFYRRGGVLYYY